MRTYSLPPCLSLQYHKWSLPWSSFQGSCFSTKLLDRHVPKWDIGHKPNDTNQVGYQSTAVHIGLILWILGLRRWLGPWQPSFSSSSVSASFSHTCHYFLCHAVPWCLQGNANCLQLGTWSGEVSHLAFIDFMPTSYNLLFCNYLTWNRLIVHSLKLCNPVVSYKISSPPSVPSDCLLQPPSAIFHKSSGKVGRGQGSFLTWSFIGHSYNTQSTHGLRPNIPPHRAIFPATVQSILAAVLPEQNEQEQNILQLLHSFLCPIKIRFSPAVWLYHVTNLHILMEEASSKQWAGRSLSKP